MVAGGGGGAGAGGGGGHRVGGPDAGRHQPGPHQQRARAGGHPAAGVQPGRGRRGPDGRLPVGPRRGPRAAPPLRAGPGPGRAADGADRGPGGRRPGRPRPAPAGVGAGQHLRRPGGGGPGVQPGGRGRGRRLPGASSVRLGNAIVQDDLTALTAATQERLGRDEDRRSQGWIIALVVVVVGLAVLGFGQAQRHQGQPADRQPAPGGGAPSPCWRRWSGWWWPQQGSGNAIRDARRQGYDSIALTAQLQTAGFGAKAAETLALVTGDASQRADADARSAAGGRRPGHARRGRPHPGARSRRRRSRRPPRPGRGQRGRPPGPGPRWPRSPSAGSATATRWPPCGRRPSPAEARAIAVGRSNAEFNGFNFSVEAVLGQSRGQFLAGLETAADRTSRVPTARPAPRPGRPGGRPAGASSSASTTTGEARMSVAMTRSAGGRSWPAPGPSPWARPAPRAA